ncbi:MAG: ABC transporter ATP-binding protein [Deltaproteobacteria bacterium]|nr:ABC transporter ATP-binding protein [Deltaproteobacteria bacterium]
MLLVQQIEVFYQHVIQVLKGVSISVAEGQIICLLGANGAGKSTTLKAISGLLVAEDGRITDGAIEFEGRRIDNRLAHDIAGRGVIQVFEGRRVLEHLTVEENLRAGHIGEKSRIPAKMERVFSLFPQLKALKKKEAGWLSGGEQQMLVIGRGLMAEPKLMMLDEPSLGLSPLLVREIFATIERINKENQTSLLLVEQNAARALEIASFAYVMENGRIVMDGPAEKIQDNPDIKEFYLGLGEFGARKSYKDVKHYKRRKRWL